MPYKDPAKRRETARLSARRRRAADPEKYRKRNREHEQRWRAKNPRGVRHRRLKVLYGMDYTLYEALLVAQNGRCAICRRKPTKRHLSVDHCHKTGKIRGLLCGKCNAGLGNLCDDLHLLRNAVAYLESHET